VTTGHSWYGPNSPKSFYCIAYRGASVISARNSDFVGILTRFPGFRAVRGCRDAQNAATRLQMQGIGHLGAARPHIAPKQLNVIYR
jgi:hypothetical protein